MSLTCLRRADPTPPSQGRSDSNLASRLVALALAAALLAACGGSGKGNRDARQWLANARGVVQQLRSDVVDASGTDRLPLARAAMRNDSQLYGLLVTYTDLGGCVHEVHALGVPPAQFAAARRALLQACRPLVRAVRLFTHAMTSQRPAALVAATRSALAAAPLLEHAALALRQ